MSERRPFAEMTKDVTEESGQNIATKRAKQDYVSLFHLSPIDDERKLKMSVSSVSSYLQKTSLLPTPPMSMPRTQPVTALVLLKDSFSKRLAKLKCPIAHRKIGYSGNIVSQSKICQLQRIPGHPADSLEVPARLREFQTMEDGWYNRGRSGR